MPRFFYGTLIFFTGGMMFSSHRLFKETFLQEEEKADTVLLKKSTAHIRQERKGHLPFLFHVLPLAPC